MARTGNHQLHPGLFMAFDYFDIMAPERVVLRCVCKGFAPSKFGLLREQEEYARYVGSTGSHSLIEWANTQFSTLPSEVVAKSAWKAGHDFRVARSADGSGFVMLKAACRIGNVAMAIHAQNWYRMDCGTIYTFLVNYGRPDTLLEMLQQVDASGHPWAINRHESEQRLRWAIKQACFRGLVTVFVWLVDKHLSSSLDRLNLNLSIDCLQVAIAFGHLQLVNRLLWDGRSGCQVTDALRFESMWTYDRVLGNISLHQLYSVRSLGIKNLRTNSLVTVVRYIRSHIKDNDFVSLTDDALQLAHVRGDFEMLEWAETVTQFVPRTDYATLGNVAEALPVFSCFRNPALVQKWVYERGLGSHEHKCMFVLRAAMDYGWDDLLLWLVGTIGYRSWTVWEALAEKRRFDIMQTLYKRYQFSLQPLLPGKRDYLVQCAAASGDIGMVMWLRSHGCEWSCSAYAQANLEMCMFLFSAGCPFDATSVPVHNRSKRDRWLSRQITLAMQHYQQHCMRHKRMRLNDGSSKQMQDVSSSEPPLAFKLKGCKLSSLVLSCVQKLLGHVRKQGCNDPSVYGAPNGGVDIVWEREKVYCTLYEDMVLVVGKYDAPTLNGISEQEYNMDSTVCEDVLVQVATKVAVLVRGK